MSYASDLGLKVGSKIKVLSPSVYFKTGDIITLTEDDYTEIPWFRGGGRRIEPFPIIDCQWEHYKEEEKGVTSATKIKFPCCVSTSEIKDVDTFEAIKSLFVVNGAEISEGDYDWGVPDFEYYGVTSYGSAKFWDWKSTYSSDGKEDSVTAYSVAELLGLVAKEEPVAEVPVTTLFPVGTEVQIAKDSEYYCYDNGSNPQDTKGIITELDDDEDFCYSVLWSNGTRNGYTVKDLVLWNEGWIEWNGGECPVAKGTVIDVKFRGGDITIGVSANMYFWEDGYYDLYRDDNDRMATHWDIDGSEGDIVAYRLHTPPVASQEAITECLEDKPSVGIDYGLMGTTASTEPLITITQEVKYTVVIKGATFTFTQEELDALTEELLGFTTL